MIRLRRIYHESTKEKTNFVLSPPGADGFVINPFGFSAIGGSGLGNYLRVSCFLSLCYRKLEQKAIFMKRLEPG
jgi:hypothetical protein